MDATTRERIRSVKQSVDAMLIERHAIAGGNRQVVTPSDYWTDFCSFFDYMLSLPEESFAKVRLHTYHLTGDNYLTYYMDTGAGASRFLAAWQQQVSGLPPTHVLSEPDGGIGYRTPDGNLVSVDTTRYQHVVKTLHRKGILDDLNRREGRKLVLEIGSGYGGMVHHLASLLNDTTFVLVDLPETLLFSAAYLTLHHPGERVWIYTPERAAELSDPHMYYSHDFVCVPNYRLSDLAHLKFDLALNVASLQEMRAEQVAEYLDFLQKTCVGPLYSWNRENANPINRELHNLTELLAERFKIEDLTDAGPPPNVELKARVRRRLRRAATKLGLLEPPPRDPSGRKRELLCRPLRAETANA